MFYSIMILIIESVVVVWFLRKKDTKLRDGTKFGSGGGVGTKVGGGGRWGGCISMVNIIIITTTMLVNKNYTEQ